MPEISVIVPVYNVENKIRRCIDSILAQSFTDFELILVDDGSPDNSGEICDEYVTKDSRICVIHQENKGASAARNRGIKGAQGDYLSFVDSDDYVDLDYLNILYHTVRISDADIAMCCYYSVAEDSSISESKHRFSDGYLLDREGIKTQLYCDIFYNSHTVGYFSLWNKLFRRDLIASNNILIDESMSFGEDMLFVMECLKYCNSIAFSDKLLYYYEVLSTGLFSQYRRGFVDDIMKCYTSLIDQTKPDDDDKCFNLSIKYWNYLNRQFYGIVKNEKKKNKEIKGALIHKDVQTLLCRMDQLTQCEADQHGIAHNDLKAARLVSQKKINIAVFVVRYQFDESYWLRRLKKLLQGK